MDVVVVVVLVAVVVVVVVVVVVDGSWSQMALGHYPDCTCSWWFVC